MSNELQLKIFNVPISELTPTPNNPRSWSEKQKKDLRKSIEKFGLCEPLLVNNAKSHKNELIGGNFRLETARTLGYKTVPVVYISLEDEGMIRELNLRLNRNTGSFNIDMLKDFDVDLLFDVGFDDKDLSDIWDDVLEIEDDNFKVDEELKKIKNPKTKLGDLYQLGKHRLYCADSTKIDTLKALLGDIRVDMAYSDCPYNINLSYDSGIGTDKKYGGKTNDNLSQLDYYNFVLAFLENTRQFLKPDAHVFTWCDENYLWMFQGLYRELGIDLKRVCLWIKNNQNVTPQIAFNKAYEPCVYGTVGSPYLSEKVKNLNEVLNKEVGTGNSLLDDIQDYLNIWLVKRLPSDQYEHPTQKPITLHEKPLRRCTKPGDVVLDLFSGSGSTLLACEQMNRVCYTAEIDPIFCDLTISRWERATNDKAKLIS